MSVLITGVAGFIGSRLAEEVIAAGESVVGVDRMSTFYDPEIKRRNIAQVAGVEQLPLDRGRPERDRPRAADGRGRGRLPPRRSAGRACRAGAANSRSTSATTSWPPSASWRPRAPSAWTGSWPPRPRPSTVTPRATRDRALIPAADLPLRRHEARLRGALQALRDPVRRRDRRPSLLHDLRPEAAPGHGVQPVHRGGAVRAPDRGLRRRPSGPRLHLRRRRRRRDDRIGHERPARRDVQRRGRHRGQRARRRRPARPDAGPARSRSITSPPPRATCGAPAPTSRTPATISATSHGVSLEEGLRRQVEASG